MKKNGLVVCLCMLFLFLSGCQSQMGAGTVKDARPDDKLSLGSVTLTVENKEVKDEVKPEKPDGYFDYYEKQEGYHYYVVTGMAKNDGSQKVDAENVLVQGINDKTTYDGKLLFSDIEDSKFVNELDSGKERKFRIIILIKDDKPDPLEIDLFFNQGFAKQKDKKEYDNLLKWRLR